MISKTYRLFEIGAKNTIKTVHAVRYGTDRNPHIVKSQVLAHYQNNQPVLNISLKELKSLLAKTGTEFDNFAQRIAQRILNIDNRIAPKVKASNQHRTDCLGFYSEKEHKIYLFKELADGDCYYFRLTPDKKMAGIAEKLTRLKLIIHEMVHAKQNIDILRTEGLSDKWIHYIANRRAVQEVKNFHNKYKNKTLEEFLQFANKQKWSQATIDYHSQYFDAKAESPEKLERFLVHMKKAYIPFYKKQLLNFRSNILKVLPEIKQGTPEAEYNKALFKNYRHYIPVEEGIHYRWQLVELDAEYVAQKMRLDALRKMPKMFLREGKRVAAIFNFETDFEKILLK